MSNEWPGPAEEGSPPINFENVRQATVEAIRQAALEAYETISKADLFGFGICTHDDVDSVYHVYATRDWVRDNDADYPEIGYISNEWTQASGDELFLSLSKTYWRWAADGKDADPSTYDRERTVRFRAIVEALEICRNEGLFDANTLLSVCSTDPDDLMCKLNREAAGRINTEEVATSYRKIMGC